jgi:hypothetical protein
MENIKESTTSDKYLESMRKANRKYRENNKAKFNEYQKQYYHSHKSDEEYMKKQRQKALKYYYKKKEQEEAQNTQNI